MGIRRCGVVPVVLVAWWTAGGASFVHAQEPSPPKSQAPAQADMLRADCALLVKLQEGEGRREWPYEGVYRTSEAGRRRVIPIGYRVGGTAIVAHALVRVPGYAEDQSRVEAVARGVEFILESLDHDLMQPTTEDRYDVRGWGHVYALSLLLLLRERDLVPVDVVERVEKACVWLVDALEASDIEAGGGWNYANHRSASPFMTAPAIQALEAAKRAGLDVDAETLELAYGSLDRTRTASGGMTYATRAESPAEVGEDELRFMDKLPGSIGRMAAVEATLAMAGRGDQERLVRAAESFFEHWQQLEVRRKQNGTHIPPYGVAPYYFMYAHYYVAQAIARIESAEVRAELGEKLRATLMRVREEGGGWNDRVFERSLNYGTSMGVLALLELDTTAPVGKR